MAETSELAPVEKLPRQIAADTGFGGCDYREQLDLLRSRIQLLTGKDRIMMSMYFENGISFGQIAALCGMSEARLTRRMRAVTKRLMDGRYIACIRNRHRFTLMELGLARDNFLLGLSYRKIAVKRNLSFYRVRETMSRVKRMIGESTNL